jgi:hypothetical protein
MSTATRERAHTVLVDVYSLSETHWRADWDRAWGMLAKAGGTAEVTDPGDGTPMLALHRGHDGIVAWGSGRKSDLRQDMVMVLCRLGELGALRGWYGLPADPAARYARSYPTTLPTRQSHVTATLDRWHWAEDPTCCPWCLSAEVLPDGAEMCGTCTAALGQLVAGGAR